MVISVLVYIVGCDGPEGIRAIATARCGVVPVRAIGRVCSGVSTMLAKTMAMMVFITVLAPAVGIALFVLLQSI